MNDFQGKTVLVTGSSSGIGKGIALGFAKEGAQVVITYSENKSGADEVSHELEKIGAKFLVIQADVTKESEAEKVVNETLKYFNNLDIVVNNVGRYFDGDEWNLGGEAWKKSIDVNLLSTLNVSKYAGKYFVENKKGNFINIASVHALKGVHDAISYSASKAGVVSITQSYMKMLAPFGRANTISPAQVNTSYWLTASQDEIDEVKELIPLKKFCEVEDIVNGVLFIASDKAKMINGHNLVIDGGYCIK